MKGNKYIINDNYVEMIIESKVYGIIIVKIDVSKHLVAFLLIFINLNLPCWYLLTANFLLYHTTKAFYLLVFIKNKLEIYTF